MQVENDWISPQFDVPEHFYDASRFPPGFPPGDPCDNPGKGRPPFCDCNGVPEPTGIVLVGSMAFILIMHRKRNQDR